MAGIRYKGKIFSGAASYSSADEVSYDNSDSGLTADNVQDAVDELNSNAVSTATSLSNRTDAHYGYATTDSNGFIKFKIPNDLQLNGWLPYSVFSATNGVYCILAYMEPDTYNFYVKCFTWDGNVAANRTVGCYVLFSKYTNKNDIMIT